MAEETKLPKNKGGDGASLLISFLAGAAAGVGLILFAEAKSKISEDTSYGDADLFV